MLCQEFFIAETCVCFIESNMAIDTDTAEADIHTAKLPDPPKPTPTPGDDDGYKPGWPGGSILGPGSNSNVPTPPTAEMPVTGGEESILPIAMLIAGAVMLVALRRKKRV